MIKILLCALLLTAAPASAQTPAAPAASARTDDARLAVAVDAVAAKALADKAAAGFAIGVVENGRVRLARGYGLADLENRVPVTDRTVFRIGSVTKEFTAAAVLLLAERGRLSLDDKLAKYLPNFPRANEVTVRQLLNHTSGIRNYTSVPDFMATAAPREMSADAMIAYMVAAAPVYDFAPGTAWSYSNSGYYLLGAIIEKASGQPHAQFIRANLLDPLGLRDTRFDDMAEIVPGRAKGYDKLAAAPSGFGNSGHLSLSVAAAAGAMRSTVSDLARWHEALLGGRVLKPASVALMTAPGRLADGRLASTARPAAYAALPPSDFGFGIASATRDGRRSVGHGGSINGFNANVQTYPDSRTTIVLLTNTGGGTATIMPALVGAVFAPTPLERSR